MSKEALNGNFAKPMLNAVLSVFDGMSCGQLALQRAGIEYKEYYASEIDKHAIKVTQNNFPNTKQLGSITELKTENLPIIDLFIGGSPCQSFSSFGNGKGFNGKSGLFWEYVRVLKELKLKNPNIKFMLENVNMKKEWCDIISSPLIEVHFWEVLCRYRFVEQVGIFYLCK